MDEANLKGRDPETLLGRDPNYVSLKVLQSIEAPTCVQVRQFLWDEIGMKGLFSGTSITEPDDGSIGVLEYLVPNMSIADIHGCAVMDLAI